MSAFKQKLLNDLIAVEIEEETGTIRMPDWQKPLRGVVVAVGPGKMLYDGTRAPMEVGIGDRVVFSANAGMETSYGIHTSLRMMKDDDVLGILEETCPDCGYEGVHSLFCTAEIEREGLLS
jgi:chaperonin GroES